MTTILRDDVITESAASGEGRGAQPHRHLLDAVVASFEPCDDDRLRALLQALVRHLYDFVVETSLSEREWQQALGVLSETGQVCAAGRPEFELWSDTLGISTLIDLLAHGAEDATDSTVRGPFWVPGSPWRAWGEAITERPAGEPARFHGVVRDSVGNPLPGAVVDVWQNGADNLYGVQDATAPPGHLRGRLLTDEQGRYSFIGVRPTPYRVPDDGPVGAMLRATGRGSWRPGHVHMTVTVEGFLPLTTHVFDADSPYLDEDAVFAVKPSLLRAFVPHPPSATDTPPGVTTRWYDVEFDVRLAAAP